MRKNKFIKLIEHILVALPILMIVATTCYTIFNSNAKDSWSGHDNIDVTYRYTSNEVTDTTDLVIGNLYEIDLPNIPLSINNGEYLNVSALYFKRYSFTDMEFFSSQRMSIVYSSNAWYVRLYDDENVNINSYQIGSNKILVQYLSTTGNTNTIINYINYTSYNEIVSVENNPTDTLDKAFEYSMSEFNNLGFDKINFTGFFEDIFFEGQPNVYLSFVNCYLNYMLLIECAFILPLVLYWFIHVGESILYRFERGEW